VVLYRGEYRIQYTVRGERYLVWTDSGLTSPDKHSVEEQIKKLPVDCPVRVKYNRLNPAQNVSYVLPR
jgi:hypothetical protein